MSYDENKTEEVPTKKKINTYYSKAQSIVCPKTENVQYKVRSPHIRLEQRLKKEPVKIKILTDRKNGKELYRFEGREFEDYIKTFPTKLLKYNSDTAEVNTESDVPPSAVIENET